MAILPDPERANERRDEMIDERREARASGIMMVLLLGPIFLGTVFMFASGLGFIH